MRKCLLTCPPRIQSTKLISEHRSTEFGGELSCDPGAPHSIVHHVVCSTSGFSRWWQASCGSSADPLAVACEGEVESVECDHPASAPMSVPLRRCRIPRSRRSLLRLGQGQRRRSCDSHGLRTWGIPWTSAVGCRWPWALDLEGGIRAAARHRRQAPTPGIPRLNSTSNPGPAARPAASLAAWVGGGRSRRMPRTCPLRGLSRIAMPLSLSPSSVTEPPGPSRVMLARLPSHPGRTGRTNANDDLPSPSRRLGHGEAQGESSAPPAVYPVIRWPPAESGRKAGASTTEGGVQIEFAVGVLRRPTEGGTLLVERSGSPGDRRRGGSGAPW